MADTQAQPVPAQTPASAQAQKPEAKKAVVKLQSWGGAMATAIGRLRKFDLRGEEDKTGVFLNPRVLGRALAWDNEVFAAYIAQRERLSAARQPTTIDSMIAAPHGNDLRDAILGNWYLTRKLSECELYCKVPPGDKALTAFAAFLNEATAKLLAREYLGKGSPPKAPKYSAVGVGVDSIDLADSIGHSESLKAAQAARKEQKA